MYQKCSVARFRLFSTSIIPFSKLDRDRRHEVFTGFVFKSHAAANGKVGYLEKEDVLSGSCRWCVLNVLLAVQYSIDDKVYQIIISICTPFEHEYSLKLVFHACSSLVSIEDGMETGNVSTKRMPLQRIQWWPRSSKSNGCNTHMCFL